jgi:hypothetical protein
MDETIVAASVKFHGVVCTLPPPARHHHVLHAIHAVCPDEVIGPDEQGFVTSTGRWVDRPEAKRIAIAAGQVIDNGRSHVFSEDLW